MSLSTVFNAVKLPRRLALFSDLILWLLLLLTFIVAGRHLLKNNFEPGQFLEVQFKNASEISRGSSVRFMGSEIGYVSNVQIKNNQILVSIKTYPDTPIIPKGSIFNIQFSGLGGSKSIEIELPRKKTSISGNQADSPTAIKTVKQSATGMSNYVVEETISLKDMEDSMLDSTQALQKGAENTAIFFDTQKSVEELQYNIHQTYTGMEQGILAFKQANTIIHQFETDRSHMFKPVLKGLQQAAHGIQNIDVHSQFNHNEQKIWRPDSPIQRLTTHLSEKTQNAPFHNFAFHCKLQQNRFQSVENYLTSLSLTPIIQLNNGLINVDKKIDCISDKLDFPKTASDPLNNFHKGVNAVNNWLVQFLSKPEKQ